MGFIYCIRSLIDNKVIYIGSTKQSMGTRISKHKFDAKIDTRAKPIHKYINTNGGWCNYQFQKLNELDENILKIYEKKIIADYKDKGILNKILN